MDFGNILAQGLLGGTIGYSNARMDDFTKMEEQARREGELRLMQEFKIDERAWQERQSDKADARDDANRKSDALIARQNKLEDRQFQTDLSLEERGHSESLARENRAFSEENRRYDQGLKQGELDKKTKKEDGKYDAEQDRKDREEAMKASELITKQYQTAMDSGQVPRSEDGVYQLPQEWAKTNSTLAYNVIEAYTQKAGVEEPQDDIYKQIDGIMAGNDFATALKEFSSSLTLAERAKAKQYAAEKYGDILAGGQKQEMGLLGSHMSNQLGSPQSSHPPIRWPSSIDSGSGPRTGLSTLK